MRPSILLLSLAFACGLGGRPALAQTCPADLSALDSEIQTESLRVGLFIPLADRVQRGGGVNAMIAKAEEDVARLYDQRDNLAPSTSEELRRTINEAILLLDAELSALRCLQAQS
jgi:hypothetical protein